MRPHVRTGLLPRALLAHVFITAAVSCATPAWSSAADGPATDPWADPISPDRPGAATPPTVLKRGELQIETAFESQIARPPDAPNATTQDFPTLLRFGLGHSLEVRLESNTVSLHEAVTGFADMSVEAKWLALSHTDGSVPSVALLPAVTLPSGTSGFTAGKVQAWVSGLLGWTLPSRASLSIEANAARVLESSDGPYVWQLGTQCAFQIPVSRHWAVNGDLFVSAPLVSGATTPWGGDAGAEYYPNPDTQLDLVVIHTLTEPGTATAVQVGFSRRFGLGGARH